MESSQRLNLPTQNLLNPPQRRPKSRPRLHQSNQSNIELDLLQLLLDFHARLLPPDHAARIRFGEHSGHVVEERRWGVPEVEPCDAAAGAEGLLGWGR